MPLSAVGRSGTEPEEGCLGLRVALVFPVQGTLMRRDALTVAEIAAVTGRPRREIYQRTLALADEDRDNGERR